MSDVKCPEDTPGEGQTAQDSAADGQTETRAQSEVDKDAAATDPKPAPGSTSDQATDSIEALRELLEEANRKAEENWEQVLRSRADMENLRKRATRDVEHAHKYALERFVNALLPVKDSMELGLSAADASEDIAVLKDGMDLTLKMLATALDKCGVKEIDAANQRFDPELHQAMTMQDQADVEPGTVLTVIQKGYLLNDRLARAATVIVAKAPGS